MTIPDYQSVMLPLLRLAADDEGRKPAPGPERKGRHAYPLSSEHRNDEFPKIPHNKKPTSSPDGPRRRKNEPTAAYFSLLMVSLVAPWRR